MSVFMEPSISLCDCEENRFFAVFWSLGARFVNKKIIDEGVAPVSGCTETQTDRQLLAQGRLAGNANQIVSSSSLLKQ